MPGFDAATVVEPLDYTFSSCKKKHEGPCWSGLKSQRPKGCTVWVPGCEGTIPEPTDDQIAQFLTDVKAFTAKFKDMVPEGVDGDDPTQLIAALNDLDPQIVKTVNGEAAEIFAALCSGELSKAVLLKVPPRIRNMFYAWLQQEVMSPEAVPGGGSAQAVTLQPAAAG